MDRKTKIDAKDEFAKVSEYIAQHDIGKLLPHKTRTHLAYIWNSFRLRYEPHAKIVGSALITGKTKTATKNDFIKHNSESHNKRHGFGATKNINGTGWAKRIQHLVDLNLVFIGEDGIVCLNLAYSQNISQSECHKDLRELIDYLGDADGTALAVRFVQKIIYTKFVAVHGESDDFKLYLESNDVFDNISNLLSENSFVETADAVYGIAHERMQSKFRFDCAKNVN